MAALANISCHQTALHVKETDFKDVASVPFLGNAPMRQIYNWSLLLLKNSSQTNIYVPYKTKTETTISKWKEKNDKNKCQSVSQSDKQTLVRCSQALHLSVAMQWNQRSVTTASTAGPVTWFSSGPSISSAHLCWMTHSIISIVFPPRVGEDEKIGLITPNKTSNWDWFSNLRAVLGQCRCTVHRIGFLKPQILWTQLFVTLL